MPKKQTSPQTVLVVLSCAGVPRTGNSEGEVEADEDGHLGPEQESAPGTQHVAGLPQQGLLLRLQGQVHQGHPLLQRGT